MSSIKKAFSLRKPRSGENSATGSDAEGTPRSRTPTGSRTSTNTSAISTSTVMSNGSTASAPSTADVKSPDSITPRHSLDILKGRTSIDSSKTRTSTGMSKEHRHALKGDGHHRTHSPFRALKHKMHHHRRDSEGSHSSTEDIPFNREGEVQSKNQLRKHERQLERERQRKEVEERVAADRARKEEMERKAREEDSPEMRARYGIQPANSYAGENKHEPYFDIRQLTPEWNGKEVEFRARIHNMRKISAKLVFLELRQQTTTIQGILQEHAGVSGHFLYWAEHLHVETIVRVKGAIQEPKVKGGEVKSVSIHNVEIHIHEMHVQAAPTEPLPFTVHEAEVSKAEIEREGDDRHRVSDRARWSNRIIDLRTTASQAIFRIQSGICQIFRSHLDELGFVEIHTPKLQAAATESGASVFKVNYFDRPAFLAQSPQLAKQMSMAADMRRVFEIGAVFRAENSNTHRHLTEYTGLDIEMAIDHHYHEVLEVLDSTFKAIFEYIYKRYRPEVEAVKRQFPHEDLVWLEKTPILPFAEAIRMLNETGWLGEDGKPLPEDEDLGTRDEIQLGRVVKEKLGTDYYVLDKFPIMARPFYAMPDPHNPKVTNAFDIFLRGQEILSGGQRIHDAKMLTDRMVALKMDPKTMQEYMDGFEWGAPPHGGGGIGLERILMLFLQLGDIRNASLFARDPKSLPERVKVVELRHPESSTLHPPWSGRDRAAAGLDFQPLPNLIANYGDASNTSWLEPKFEIWRADDTGAAVGFVSHEGFAITVGDPLCHESQYAKTIAAYLQFIKKKRHIKPLWLLCGGAAEQVLAEKFDWRTFSVAAEQRVDPGNNPAVKDAEVQRKIRHAEKEGVKLHDFELGDDVPQEFKDRIDQRVKDWLSNRKGKQVHLTDVHPWQDQEHRQYHYSTDKDGQIAGLVIMAQLSPQHGWQVKFSLDFPGAPSGAIEYLVLHALKQVANKGATSATFGGGAMAKFVPGHNLKGTRVKVLSKAYHAIATELRLTAKSEFREKLGAVEDLVYVCYPPHGLGPSGVRAILSFFEDDDDAGKV